MGAPEESKQLLAPQDGSVTVSTEPDVTEKEINDDRELVIQRLDGAYQDLIEAMAPFQEKWNAGWKSALTEAIWDGAAAGISEWGSDFAEFFEKKTWVDLGEKIEKAAGSAYDTAADYAANFYNGLRERVNKGVKQIEDAPENAGETLQNWVWQVIDDTVVEPAKQLEQRVESTVKSVSDTVVMARKIYGYRNKIAELPEKMAAGDVNWVENFVDVVVKDIDPEMAKAIKQSDGWPIVLEIIQDHESVLSYLAYAGLTFEAVPPNFYAYVAGKGGAYLTVEVVLLVITALLSAGTAAAARLASLGARIAMSSSKVAKVAKKIERIQEAFNAFLRVIDDFSHAADEMHALGAKLLRARTRGFRVKGSTKTTVAAKKESIKREKKCRICGKTTHATPHGRFGTVKYE